VRGGGAKEHPDCPNVALEGEIVGPRIGSSRTPSDDAFGLCDIDRMKLKARCSNVGHGRGESAPIAGQPGSGDDRELPAAMMRASEAASFERARMVITSPCVGAWL
jgi:hypothetical protein